MLAELACRTYAAETFDEDGAVTGGFTVYIHNTALQPLPLKREQWLHVIPGVVLRRDGELTRVMVHFTRHFPGTIPLFDEVFGPTLRQMRQTAVEATVAALRANETAYEGYILSRGLPPEEMEQIVEQLTIRSMRQAAR